MKKIYDFSRFSSLYEADTASQELKVSETEASKLYDQTLSLILTTALNSYASELSFPIANYDPNIDADITSVKSSPIENKPAALVQVMQKVQKAAEDNKLEGAKEAVDAWVATGSKAADALSAMINQYKGQPEELKHINDFVNAKLDSFMKEIEDSAKENDLKMQIAAKANESESHEGEEVFEGIGDLFQGKKGMIGDVSKQITLVNAKLSSLAQTPGMSADVQRLQNEVTQISSKMGELLGKPNKEINKDEIKKAAARLAEIPTEADKIAEKMLKQDATNKEASSILVQALALAQDAKNKEVNYLQKKEEALQKDKESKIKVKISSDRIDYDPDNTRTFNKEVKTFQELVVDKFGKIKQIADLPQFKAMGTDGKFGKGTRDIVTILKKGFGLADTSKDITKELIDEIQIQPIKESESKVLSFQGYVSLYEDFDVSVAVDTAKSLPSYTPSSTKSSSKPGMTSSKPAMASSKPEASKEVAKPEVKKEVAPAGPLKQALTNVEIQNIAKELIDASSGSTDEAGFLSAIEKLKNKADFSILNSLLSRSYKERGSQNSYIKQKEMGLSSASQYADLQSMINGEMGSDDTGTVRLINDHLNKIGVNSFYRFNKGNKEFIEDSFTIGN